MRNLLILVALIAAILPGAAWAGGSCCPPPCCEPHVYYCNSPCRCCETVQQVIEVCHPCTGCKIPVQVCLPACCTGDPCVSCRRTLFACGETRFTWCCGHGVKVRFLKCGDVKVAYF